MLFEVMLPAKFCPDDVIIPLFPIPFSPSMLLNLKLPESKLVSLVASSSKISASKVDTPTALFIDFTSLNPKSSTFVMTLPF